MSTCIVCQSQEVGQFLDFGKTALANKFLTKEELSKPEPKHPLRVGFCNHCGHVQLIDRVLPQMMFEDYLYISSASDTLKAHLYELSDVVVNKYRLGSKDLVMDIGCNDGTLLHGFLRHGVRVLGVDPAKNLAALADGNGIDRYVGFFNLRTSKEIIAKWGQASVITATNTFPHIPELQDFILGIKTALAPGGVFIIEAHYLMDILSQRAFDTVYHEHVSYWALGPMKYLFKKNGMQIVNAERLPIHHGQLRVFIQRAGEGTVRPAVQKILELERSMGMDRVETYLKFSETVIKIKEELKRTLKELKAQHKRVAGYGAPAKGNTLLSFLELGPESIPYIVDRSPLKQGRYTPGTHIPIAAPKQLLVDQPDYALLLAWNFADEVLAQQKEYRKKGGRFIIPVPHIKIL